MMERAEISLYQALNPANALYLRSRQKPNVVELPLGMVKPCGLPLETIKRSDTGEAYV